MKITVYGSGGWGTATALLLSDNGHDVTLWSYTEENARVLGETRQSPRLPGVTLPDGVISEWDIERAASGAEMAVMATPSFAVTATAKKLRGILPKGCLVVCVSKGIEKDTSLRFSQILRNELGDDIRIASLSGPTHAEEVGRRMPTACVAAADDLSTAELVQEIFMNDRFRVYTSDDVVGVEIGAALKNIIALCAGISDGLGFGDNTKAMLMTRGLNEMADLTVSLGGRRETLAGLAGVGDLIVTCTSMHSRNRRAGIYIGEGMSVQDAMDKAGAVVEGYYAAKAAYELSRKQNVEMPIITQAYKVLYEGKRASDAVRELMSRERKSELNFGRIWR